MVILVSVLGVVWHPPTPPKLGGDGSCGYQILPTSHSHETGKKFTHLFNVRVKQLSISQKLSFWCWYWGWFDTPQHPQNLVGMVHVATKFCPQVPPMRQGKTFTSLLNVRVNQLSISQKWLFGVGTWGGLTPPQHPQNLVGMGHVGTKFCPQVLSMRVWKKRPIC